MRYSDLTKGEIENLERMLVCVSYSFEHSKNPVKQLFIRLHRRGFDLVRKA